MIQDQVQKLAQKLTQYDQLQRNKQRATQLEPVRQRLHVNSQNLMKAASDVLMLQERCDAGRVSRAVVNDLVTKLAAVRERDADSANAEDWCGGRDTASLIKSLEEASASLKKLADEAWQRYLRNARPRVDESELRRFEHSAKHRDTVIAIRFLREQAMNVSMPANSESFDKVAQMFSELREQLAKLPRRSDNPEVRAFQDAAESERGADLDLLTTAVRKYLAENGLSSDYRIRR